jgi:hypothetical protein|tara:strand:- start:1668 stop:2498 length:831 start_codon:yes stop_codon:yes gene_type:complete
MIISENIVEILSRYLLTVNNYNRFFFKNISIYKDTNFLKNLHVKGLLLINNIFNISLLYLDSLVDIYNLCEKGYVYFVEFVNQINITNSFELTLKDAVIFSYKKTIFTFDNTIQTSISNTNKFKLKIINTIISIINNSSIIVNSKIYNLYNNHTNEQNIFEQEINTITLNLSKLIKKIFIATDLNSKQLEVNQNLFIYLENISIFLNFINQNYNMLNHLNLEEFHRNILIFIEKYISKKIFQKKIDIFSSIDTDSLKTLEKYENIQPLINSICKSI